MSYELFNTQPTIQGRTHGKAASLNGVGNRGVFKRESLKFEDAGDSANYLTSVAKTLARSVSSTWASVYELSRDVKDSEAWAALRPASGDPPGSFADWWTTIFGQPISAFMELEHRYCLIKEYQPQLLTELNYDQARQLVEQLEKRHEHFVAKDQQTLDLFAERMPEEKREELQERIDAGERVTQAEVAAAAGVTRGRVAQVANQNVQQNGNVSDPAPPSTLATRRYEKLSAIPGMVERIAAGESMRALAVEAGIEQPSLCLPRNPSSAVARILRDFGGNSGWLLAVTEQLTHYLTENHANATEAEELGSDACF